MEESKIIVTLEEVTKIVKDELCKNVKNSGAKAKKQALSQAMISYCVGAL